MNSIDLTVNGEKLEVREGKALELFNPEIVKINGVLNAPLKYIEKRVNTLNQLQCHVLVDRDKMSITLVINEKDHFGDIIRGMLELSPDFERFGINTGQYRTTLEMAEFIKMNRAFFENRSEAMNLVYQLRKFKAKVDKEVEAEYQPNKGDKRVLMQQVVDSNIPESFNVLLPLFKGYSKQNIEVETYFNPDDMTCTLVSPGANESIIDFKDEAINEVLEKIKELASEIVIIEQ